MKIFITGASGFVGGAITSALALNHEVVAMSRSRESDDRIQSLGAEPVHCDLEIVKKEHLKGCDMLIHCAARIGPGGPREYYWATNVMGTDRLLHVAKRAGVKKFIHIGTEAGCFYGQHMREIDEYYPLSSKSPFYYSESKAEAERRVMAANDHANNFEALSIRPRFVWGPGDQTILPGLIDAAEKGMFRWIDNGRCITSTTHIDNLVYAVTLAIEKGKGGEAYFVTDNENHSFHDFLTRLLNTQGIGVPDKSVPGWLVRALARLVEGLWGLFNIASKPPITRFEAALMSRDCTISIDKARRELGYKPLISVDEGMLQLKSPFA